jgi:hypothetical protein
LYGELDFDPLAVGLGPEEVCIDELHLVQVLQLLQAQRHQLSRDKRKKFIKLKQKTPRKYDHFNTRLRYRSEYAKFEDKYFLTVLFCNVVDSDPDLNPDPGKK